jgi:hypothetical protein
VTAAKDAQLLARFDAGSPAVLERRAGNGRVLLWASALDRSASDLPLMGIFPVMVREAVLHLAAFHETQPAVTVGEVLNPSVAAAPKGSPAARVVRHLGPRPRPARKPTCWSARAGFTRGAAQRGSVCPPSLPAI